MRKEREREKLKKNGKEKNIENEMGSWWSFRFIYFDEKKN